MSEPLSPSEGGPLELLARLRTDQQLRWQRGECVWAEDYRRSYPELQTDAETFLDLVFSEFLLRRALGEEPTLEEYGRRFPEFERELRGLPDVVKVYDEMALPLENDPGRHTPSLPPTEVPGASPRAVPTPVPGPPRQTPAGQRLPTPTPGGGAAAAPTMPAQIGRFQLRARLGAGAFGTVYRAFDPELDRDVAVKVPHDGILANPEALQRFRREARAAAKLQHPHIVTVYEVGEDGPRPYIVSAFIEGRTLSQAAAELDFRQAARIVAELAEALEYAHQKGIIHRDVKPANVMLDADGRAALMDFGLAHLQESPSGSAGQTVFGTVVGTPAYLAPEQAGGWTGQAVPASDQYSLGVVLYELLCGRTPFAGGVGVVLDNTVHAEIPPPRGIRPDVPPELERICLRCLRKDPGQRFPGCQHFAEALRRWLTQAPVRQPGVVPRFVLLYKRQSQPDEQLLQWLEQQLQARGYEVFIDRHLKIGVQWAQELERQLRDCDAVVVLLSAAGVSSEMLAWEVQTAHEAFESNGRPRLLPVRVDYAKPLPDELARVLDRLQYFPWKTPADNQQLLDELLGALQGPRPDLGKIPPPTGVLPLDNQFYLERQADREFREAIGRRDSVIRIRGARQVGKTSLLARGLQEGRKAGARVVVTDFQKLNASDLQGPELLFRALGGWLADQLDLDTSLDKVWNPRRGPCLNFERFVRKEILAQVQGPVVWGMDEVDRLFTCSYRSEVFGLFRSWHNDRATEPASPWGRLTLVIAYATEAHLFIDDLNQSPFNVGTLLVLEDFTPEQVAELNRRYGSPLYGAAEIERYYQLVGGHPYLTNRGLDEMVRRPLSLTAFAVQANREDGCFGDHLRRLLVLLSGQPELRQVVAGVLRGQGCPTEESFYRLRSAGILAGESARSVRPRCQLYASYLERYLS
jgi:hypothetical protein